MKAKKLPNGPYNPNENEPKSLELWLTNNYYTPQKDTGKKTPFTIINPPPNAYARPHMGNITGYAYQDVFGRKARMQGNPTLLFPGKDHAAQQAEIVYIRDVLTPQGKKKSDFTREEFYKNAYEYFTQVMEVAQADEKRVGLSADFNRDLFTLDPRVEPTIYRTFGKMWKDNMVYKGVRIVNWSPGLNSAVADIDTERQTIKAKLYYLKYSLEHVDQDILNIREFIKKNQKFEIKVQEILEKLANSLLITAEIEEIGTLNLWFPQSSSKEVLEGATLMVYPTDIVIPLTNNAEVVATTEESNKKQQLEESLFDEIFMNVNKRLGSSFIKNLNNDDEHTENDYARAFILATVRPETKFGDTAFVVHPEDSRYSKYHNQILTLQGINGPVRIRIITDPVVDKDFGTGMIKLTPAHAPTDYDIYVRYNQQNPENPLKYKNIIEKDGKLNHLTGNFAGMHAEKDRKKIAELFKEAGIIVHEQETTSNITICERTKTVIQPIMSSQWFIDTDRLKQPAINAVENEKIKIHPDYMQKKLVAWLKNLRDWPISRSIWWGYRLPVWYKGEVSEVTDEYGQIKVSIGGKVVEDMQDAINKGLMKIDYGDNFSPLLIPSKHGFAANTQFAEIKKDFPWAEILQLTQKVVHNPTYEDYWKEFSRLDFSEHKTVVAHSLGAPAILDYILEEKIKLQNLILIAPVTTNKPRVEKWQKKGFFKNISSYNQLNKSVNQITIICSNDDNHANLEDYKSLSSELNAALVIEKGKKHFYGKEYNKNSENLQEILRNISEQDVKTEHDLTQNKKHNLILVPGRSAPEFRNEGIYTKLASYFNGRFDKITPANTGEIDQSYEEYEKVFDKIEFNENSCVVAHSLGAPAILDYLINSQIKIGKLILLAPSNQNAKNFELYQERGFWKRWNEYNQINTLTDEIVLIYSDNDDHYPVSAFEDFATDQFANTNIKLVLEEGKKHFNTNKYVYESESLKTEIKSYVENNPSDKDKSEWIQDEDVFDTWFSSGQWPLATLKAEGLMNHYPTQVMETGYDILELWVSRMIMLGLYNTDEIPFENVYLHGLIKAEDGQKMSKSKGNIVYAEDIIDEYGADTLRLFYLVGNKAGASYRVDRRKIKGYRNFLNKMWNASRFCLMQLSLAEDLPVEISEIHNQKALQTFERLNIKLKEINFSDKITPLDEYQQVAKSSVTEEFSKDDIQVDQEDFSEFSKLDLSMLSSLKQLIDKTNEHFNSFRPGMAVEELIQHFWHTFADIYLEQTKNVMFLNDREGNEINRDKESLDKRAVSMGVLLYSLSIYLRLMHPFIPFITESLWQHLPNEITKTESIIISEWPELISEK